MRPTCEIVARKVLPHIRARLVKVLVREHGLHQTEVAQLLGITQAAVSHYLNSSRGKDRGLGEMFPEIDNYVRDLSSKMIEYRRDGEDPSSAAAGKDLLCGVCQQIINDDRFEDYRERNG